ncbi:trihelix transcription factor DF1-like [Zingiber officinale]|uniref:Myb-like domain-containing protein n=1 Tax=Zingiber officinale TaxID=94328 RepID=A0A8J5HJ81_ZINOF|nr:trihelix transcription factor DF1-like [Zingiber officinale]KAG6517521.1 hypothetical protein ZIOFF_020913 [Zingiber officinale]
MQSSYGGVSEIQQFMVESCGPGAPSLFSSTAADIHSAVAGGGNPLKYQTPPPPPAAAGLPPHFAHFHSIPITQQLFQQPPPAAAHQFQLFHPHHHQLNYQPLEPRRLQIPHHQLGLDQDSGAENSASSARVTIPTAGGGLPSFLAEAMNFKLAVNESSGGGSREGINDEDGILRGGDDDGSESRLHHWQRDDESSIKELSWRPLDLDMDYINRNNKRCKNKEPDSSINGAGKVSKKNKEEVGTGSSNYKIFSELEAIYKPGGSGVGVGVGGVNQTGSGSALTGDETPLLHAPAMAPPGLAAAADCVGGMSETSAGEEAGRPGKKFSNNSSSSGRRRRKGRRWQRRLSSMATFFENLVKQLMDHQEGLHRKFLEAMESREQERTSREEAWRKQEAANSCREAAARASERKLSSSREAAIITFLEKITGESLNLPPKPQFSDENNINNCNDNNLQIEAYNEAAFGDQESNKVQFNTTRWPKTEVQALIRVRSGLESQFQEPGLKGPLWEEVSATMAAMGYLRSAKRCKEKWENINKYFRKTKESGKKRPQHSKTCPYFQQLDQLYSATKSSHNKDNILKEQRPVEEDDSEKKHDDDDTTEHKLNDNSELLDAIVVPPASSDFPSLKFGFGFDFNDKVADENTQDGGATPNTDRNGDENENENDEDEEQVGEEDDDEEEEEVEGDQEGEAEEGEGENQQHRTRHQLDQEVDELHDTSLFFQRLQS